MLVKKYLDRQLLYDKKGRVKRAEQFHPHFDQYQAFIYVVYHWRRRSYNFFKQ